MFIIVQLLLFFIFLFNRQGLFAQQKIISVEKASISGGAEYSFELEKAKKLGTISKYTARNSSLKLEKSNITSAFTTYTGLNFDNEKASSGYYHIPPDPNGAVGTTHLVSIVNTSIQFFTKDGSLLTTKHLGKNGTTATGSFFESLSPQTGTFDPKVIWDQYSNRFIVVALETTTSPGNTSRILLAVSENEDPTGLWYFTAINSKINIGGNSYADFPGLAVDDKAIYVTANMFKFSDGTNSGSRVWIIDKTPFYSGGIASVNVYDQFGLAGLASNYYASTIPAQMFGTLGTTQGTYLVSANWISGNTDYISVISITDPVGSPTFTNTFVSLGDINNIASFPSNAPQLGTSTTIDAGDSRLMSAVWRNSTLWACNTVNPPSGTDANQATAHWYKINTSSTPSLSDQGNIGGEDIAAGTYTYYPSISVNSSNAIVVSFSASAPTKYAGAYAAGRLSTDVAGSIQSSLTIQAGQDYYIRTFGSGRNRWGDFSSSSVDPSDDLTFYVFNEYAMTRGTELTGSTDDGRWATLFGIVPTSVLPVELTDFSSVVNNGIVNLTWQTATEINNHGFDVERKVISDQQSVFEKIGFVPGTGNSNSPKDYSFIDQPTGGTKFSYRLKQIDNDGNYKFYDAINVTLTENQTAELMQNSPNPFNPSTEIKFYIPTISNVSIKIYDMLGKEVITLMNSQKDAGYHIVYWNGRDKYGSDVSSGVYLYKLTAGSFTQTKKMLMLK
ncbi:MAG: T9SS type A sorting domain-containing protein [Ignavibacteriaceae bacterium]